MFPESDPYISLSANFHHYSHGTGDASVGQFDLHVGITGIQTSLDVLVSANQRTKKLAFESCPLRRKMVSVY